MSDDEHGGAVNGLELVAFGDESAKPVRDRRTGKVLSDAHYVTAAMVCFAGERDELHAQLRGLTERLGRTLHHRRLSPLQRLAAIDGIAAIDGWDGYLYETAAPYRSTVNEHHVRAKLIETALPHLAEQGVNEVVLESRSGIKRGFEALDQNDHRTLERLRSRKRVS